MKRILSAFASALVTLCAMAGTNSVNATFSNGSTSCLFRVTKAATSTEAGSVEIMSYYGSDETFTTPRQIRNESYTYDVTGVCSGALKNLANLKHIIFTDNVVSIGSDAVGNNANLQSVRIEADYTSWNVDEKAFGTATARIKYLYINEYTYNWLKKNASHKSKFQAFEKFVAYEFVDSKMMHYKLNNPLPSNGLYYVTCDRLFTEYPEFESTVIACDNTYYVTSVDSECVKEAYRPRIKEVYFNLKEIPANVFMDCSALTTVTLGPNVRTIGTSAFSRCKALTTVAGSNTALTTIGTSAFLNCESLKSFDFFSNRNITRIEDGAFFGCKALTNINLTNTKIAYIGSSAFYASGIKSAVIPASVTEMGVTVFAACLQLTSVTVYGNVIGKDMCNMSRNITSIRLLGSSPDLSQTPFKTCTALKDLEMKALTPPSLSEPIVNLSADYDNMRLRVPGYSSMTSYAADSQFGRFGYIYTDSEEIDGLYIGAVIAHGAAPVAYLDGIGEGMEGVTALDIPAKVEIAGCPQRLPLTVIAPMATYDWYDFTSVKIPSTVKIIGASAFRYQKFTEVEIPRSVEYIGSEAFGELSKLKKVRCAVNKNISTFAAADAFSGTNTASCTLEIPSGTISLYRSAQPWNGFGSYVTVAFPAEPGDANKDGEIDSSDILAMINYIFYDVKTNFDANAADINNDGVVDTLDVLHLLRLMYE